jgi:hypothetical protein
MDQWAFWRTRSRFCFIRDRQLDFYTFSRGNLRSSLGVKEPQRLSLGDLEAERGGLGEVEKGGRGEGSVCCLAALASGFLGMELAVVGLDNLEGFFIWGRLTVFLSLCFSRVSER